MPVPLTPPYLQFFDTNGAPLANGTVDTYAATTSTRKATYTDVGGATTAPNPILLNASGIPQTGNGMIFINGAYRIVVKDQYGNVIDDQPNITSFTNVSSTATPFYQSFSGTGSQTSFTLSSSLGTDSKGLMIFVASPQAGFFQKFSGTGSQTVFTLSTAKGTDSNSLVVFVYNAAAADKLGFEVQNPSTYTINGTTLTFTSAPVTGTDNIYVMQPTQQSTTGIAGYINPTLYTVNGTALTFTTAPVSGTNNIMVTAPSTLAGAAAASAAAADASATAAGNSQIAAAASASSAAAFAAAKNKWTYSSTTTMAAPGVGTMRLNNATIASATAIAIQDTSADSGNPDLSAWINTWDDASGSNRGTLYIFKDNSNFALFAINAANVDNTTWNQINVTYISGQGTWSNGDSLYLGFTANGTSIVTGGITALTGDVTASGSGSVVATIPANTVTNNQIAYMAANTVKVRAAATTGNPSDLALAASTILGRGSSGDIVGLTAGTGITIGASTISASGGVAQRQYTSTAAVSTSTTVIPLDNTIPQNTEGVQLFTLTITPKNVANRLVITAIVNINSSGSTNGSIALFQDSTVNALNAVAGNNNSLPSQIVLRHEMAAGTTSATTFNLRVGPASGTTTINGAGGAGYFNGTMFSSFEIVEYS